LKGVLADVIGLDEALTLDGLLDARVKRTPDLVAYRYFDEAAQAWRQYTWRDIGAEIARWRAAFERDGLQRGDRVAIMLRNCPEWVMCDIAALGLGLVVVPLYTQDRPDNVGYILTDAGCKALLLEGEAQWTGLAQVCGQLPTLSRIVSVKPIAAAEPRLASLSAWLPASAPAARRETRDPHARATIV
jgi:long-chain acyl-CoA synthetase